MKSTESCPDRIAVFSDIHGNFHALEAVMESIDALGIEDLVCLGDVVGYGAMPNECVDLLREREIPTLAGNHDHAAVEMTDITFFNDIAKHAVFWTRENLRPDNAKWLSEREFIHTIDPDYFFVHASPKDPAAWNYVLTFGEARAGFDCFEQKMGFIGHSHQPAVVEKRADELTCPEGHDIAIRQDCRYLINVGSVGQPRDRNPSACYVHIDRPAQKIHFVRVEYEVEAAQKAILDQNLPDELAERLAYGW